MKPQSALRSFLAIAGSSLLAASSASGTTETYYWDSNDGTDGFGSTAGIWSATTVATTTSGWSTDSTGNTAINGNSVTTDAEDTVYFGTVAKNYTGNITFSGPLSVRYIYTCPTHGSYSAAASPIITFADEGIFETAKDGTTGMPAVTINGAATSLTWRSTRTLQLFNIISSVPNTSKYILQTSPDSQLSYPGRVGVNAAAQLGPVGTKLVFDGGTLRITNPASPLPVFPYTSLSQLDAEHAVTFTSGSNAGFDYNVQFGTFTVDLQMDLGTGKFYAEGRTNFDTTIKLTQPNTMAGTYITSGTLEISQSDHLGSITSPLTFGTGNSAHSSGGMLRITGTAITSLGARPMFTTPTKPVGFDIADAANTFTVDKLLDQTTGTFTKRGAGTLVLTQNNTFTGTTTVSAGTLVINGDQSSATGNVSVSANATLGGKGTIGGSTSIATGGKLAFDISTPAGSHDPLELAAAKTLTFGGSSTLTITSTGGTPAAETYTLVTAPGGIIGAIPSTVILPLDWTAGAPYLDGTSLKINITSVSVGVSGYTSWKSANAGDQDPHLDFDNDGVENGVEYFMNAAAGFTASPALDGTNTITWPNGGNIPASAYGTGVGKQFVIQTSSDLTTWTDVLPTTNTSGPGGSLTYTLTGASPQFVRLKVTPE